MAEYVYSLEADYSGPFLIGREEFLELDRILSGLWQKLEAQRKQQITEKVDAYVNETIARHSESAKEIWSGAELDKKLKEYESEESRKKFANEYIPGLAGLSSSERKVSANCGEGKTVEGQTVKEIDNQLTLDGMTAEIFWVLYHCGTIAFAVTVTSGDESRIRIHVTPERGETSHDIFLALRTWAESLRPNRLVSLWAGPTIGTLSRGFLVLLAVCVVGVLLKLQSQAAGTDTDTIVQQIREVQLKDQDRRALVVEEARHLLAKGVSPANQTEALRILLSLEAGCYPQVPASTTPDTAVRRTPGKHTMPFAGKCIVGVLLALVGMSFIGCFPPKTRFGLGIGQAAVNRMRRWVSIITVAIPSWIFTCFILSALADLIKGWFS